MDLRSHQMSEIKIKAALVNLGCPKNQVDSEVMLGQLQRHGFSLTDDLNQAQVIIVNTCGFVEAAKEESIQTILDCARHKKTGRLKVLVAAGCLSQRYPTELKKEFPELDAIVGTGDFPRIAELSKQLLNQPSLSETSEFTIFSSQPPHLPLAGSPRHRLSASHWAYVKISEGCNYRCSFCAIPTFRGDLVSRPEADILSEVRTLAREGVKEVNLIAQSLTSYGWDRRNRNALGQLLRAMVNQEGIEWIRLYYAYPTDFTEHLMQLMASEPKICNYVDIPLQHINDHILRKMNRKGDSHLIRRLLERIRHIIPGVAIRSTVIVGFPGETEEHFQELYHFIEETRFDRLGVFTYSHEDGTSAYAIEDTVPAQVKNERQSLLINLQSEISQENHHHRIGSIDTAIVDGRSSQTQLLEGRLQGQAPEIDGVVLLEGDARPGDFVKIEVTGGTDTDLMGRIL